MPELPDISAYLTALEPRILGRTLEHARGGSPFLLRTFDPPLSSAEGKRVIALRRVGKRIAIGLEDELWLVIHLMIAGRLHWKSSATPLRGKNALLALDFADGTLTLTEAGSKRRASLHVVRGEFGLRELDPGGLEIFAPETTLNSFRAALSRENHTIKRVLTDPRVISGVGNAYSDEILHAAQLSPLAQTQKLTDEQWRHLYSTTRDVLTRWTDRLQSQAAQTFPEHVTAFRPEFAVHGKFGQPCPQCGAPVQRIRYADNETNYCPTCQTGGKVLADRCLSRLLGADWPRTLDELEALKRK